MSNKWQEATERYKNDPKAQFRVEVREGVVLLDKFLSSDECGQAQGLLRASKKDVLLGGAEGALGEVGFLFNEDGIQKSCATINSTSSRELSPCESIDAVKAFVDTNKDQKPIDIVDWLCAKLDDIADAAPTA